MTQRDYESFRIGTCKLLVALIDSSGYGSITDLKKYLGVVLSVPIHKSRCENRIRTCDFSE